jgi:hypothetical protein
MATGLHQQEVHTPLLDGQLHQLQIKLLSLLEILDEQSTMDFFSMIIELT